MLIDLTEKIPDKLRNTPIEQLILYHNFHKPHQVYDEATLIIATCIDFRIHLHIPQRFAFVLRSGGANMQNCEFYISYLLAMRNLRHIACIGHSQCAMVGLDQHKNAFVQGISNAGWTSQQASEYFDKTAHQHEIKNEILFTLSETQRLRQLFPNITVEPFLYMVENSKLYLIDE